MRTKWWTAVEAVRKVNKSTSAARTQRGGARGLGMLKSSKQWRATSARGHVIAALFEVEGLAEKANEVGDRTRKDIRLACCCVLTWVSKRDIENVWRRMGRVSEHSSSFNHRLS